MTEVIGIYASKSMVPEFSRLHLYPVHDAFITSQFLPRSEGDRPKSCLKLKESAFVGSIANFRTTWCSQWNTPFAPRDGVYSLLGLKRKAPRIQGTIQSRVLLEAFQALHKIGV